MQKKYFIIIFGLILFLVVLPSCGCVTDNAEDHIKEITYSKVEKYVSKHNTFEYILIPENEFVAVFNPEVAAWITKPMSAALITEIKDKLASTLEIQLTAKGFVRAADRDTGGKKDETNYNAVWVRDAVWIYFAFREIPEKRADARKLLLALWDYYATKPQLARFDDIIANPGHAVDKMKVPHIRFDGNSPSLDDVYIIGEPQEWNHKQNDAHGIFLIALADAVKHGLVNADDLKEDRFGVLTRFPAYFKSIKFELFEDAGAWEEINRRNTSSIGLVTRSLQMWKSLLFTEPQEGQTDNFRIKFLSNLSSVDEPIRSFWNEEKLSDLIVNGMKTVRRQLALGGESPDYDSEDIRFRRADVYLMTLIIPSPLEGLNEHDLRQVLKIIETLKRPAGILRYENDSYQSGNYWIKKPGNIVKDIELNETGDSSTHQAFQKRFKNLIPHTEAQWFFDSMLVLTRLYLASITNDPVQRKEDIHLATIHLKRALGQLTGNSNGAELITADGSVVRPFLTPESINTVVFDDKKFLLPSPIVPLNWAKAALSMALNRYEQEVFGDVEFNQQNIGK